MKVNFVFSNSSGSSNKLIGNITSVFHESYNTCPYFICWAYDINKHLLKNYKWDPYTEKEILCKLTSESWDLYSRHEVLKNTVYQVTVDIKLGTAPNCNISILDSGSWKFLGGQSFNSDEHLLKSKWTSVTIEMAPSESGIIHLHIGALDSPLPIQQEGTVFIRNLKIKSESTQQIVDNFSFQNGRFSLETKNYNMNCISLSDIDNYKNDFNVYPIVITVAEYSYSWPLLLLSKQIIDLINQDRLKILLLCSFEPIFSPIDDVWDFSVIHRQVENICRLLKITRLDNIIFAGADSTIERRVEKYKAEMRKEDPNKKLVKFKDLNTYGYITPKILESSNSIDWLEIYCNNYKNKSYLFLYLNNRIVYHRYVFYKRMEYKNLLGYGMHSWNGMVSPFGNNEGYSVFNEFCVNWQNSNTNEEQQKFIDYVRSSPGIEIKKVEDDSFDLSDPLIGGSLINPSWIGNSYFSIVTETHIGGDGMPSHITEKIYKLIFCCHPFIVVGPMHHLATLRRYGFKSFPELFDESYDSMPEGFEKHDFIANQIKFYTTDEGKKKLEQVFPILRDTLEYNRNHLLSLSVDDLWDSLKDL
jgi:hypothetical protein